MKNYVLFLLLICSMIAKSQVQTCQITRYEQTGNQLFICLTSNFTPNYLEHFFTDAEKADTSSIKAAIAQLVAQLQVRDSLYVAPPVTISRVKRAAKYQIDPILIKQERKKLDVKLKKDTALSRVIDTSIKSNLNIIPDEEIF